MHATRMKLTSLVVLHIALATAYGYSQCHTKVYEVPGNVTFAVFLSVRQHNGTAQCGDISFGSLQHVIAVKYAVAKLNAVDDSGNKKKFIPGVTLGFTVFDDCGDPEIANGHAFAVLGPTFPRDITDCEESSSLFAGVIGPSRSPTTAAVAKTLRNSGWPIITMASTLPAFSNKTVYPTVLRTATSDVHQMKAIVSMVKKMEWSMISLIYSTENYGKTGAEEIRRLAEKENICVTKQLPIDRLETFRIREIFNDLTEAADRGCVGVVYVGQNEPARYILQMANHFTNGEPKNYEHDYRALKSLLWIMPDSVGTNSELLKIGGSLSDGILTISPPRTALSDFKEFVKNELKQGQNSTIPWVRMYTKNNPCNVTKSACSSFSHADYIISTFDAVYSLATGVKNLQRDSCGGNTNGMCKNMTSGSQILKEVKKIDMRYSSMSPMSRYPREFHDRRVQFDENGDILPLRGSQLYQINMFWDGFFEEVGFYNTSSVELNFRKLRQRGNDASELSYPNLRRSSCLNVCRECRTGQQFIYVPGDVLILAFFSIHQTSDQDPFGCGKMRTETNAIPSVEAFLYMLQIKRLKLLQRVSLGAVIFDECYNPLKSNSIVSEFLSGKVELKDDRTGVIIDPGAVVAVIGSESSGVSQPLAQHFRRLNLPQVSYSASSADLDDKILYPYFLRTVPSDELQAYLMIKIIKFMKWKYFNIIYTDNIYGKKGMQKILDFAQSEHICLAKPISIKEKPESVDLNEIIKTLVQRQANVVLFFGTGDSAGDLLEALKMSNSHNFTFVASEDWGVNMKSIRGREMEAAGSLTVTIDTSHSETNNLYNYLKEKTPSEHDINPWFSSFWQDEFKCNLHWSFKNEHSVECDVNLRFSESSISSMVNDQRIVHTMNSLAAVINGLVAANYMLCSPTEQFVCEEFRKNPQYVTGKIRNTTLDGGTGLRFRPFRDDGNGNIGFRIHNLQRNSDGSYSYIEVGRDDNYGFRMQHKKIKLYSGGADRVPVTKIEAICSGEHCRLCEEKISVSEKAVEEREIYLEIILGIVCATVILLLLIIAFLICKMKSRKEKRAKMPVSDLVFRNPSSSNTVTSLDIPSKIRSDDDVSTISLSSQSFSAIEFTSDRLLGRVPRPPFPPNRVVNRNWRRQEYGDAPDDSHEPGDTHRPSHQNRTPAQKDNAADGSRRIKTISQTYV